MAASKRERDHGGVDCRTGTPWWDICDNKVAAGWTMRWAMSGRMSGGPWYWWINECQEDDADKTEETEAIHLPNRSRASFGVGKAVVSVRNKAGASGGNKGLCRLAGGDGNRVAAVAVSGRLLAQKADGENIQSEGK